MNSKNILSLGFALLLTSSVLAQGGMWPLSMLQSRAEDMKQEGLQIPISEIYDSLKPALNDAVVLFGEGCTGEIVSREGLLFTNHHCGYKYAQSLSNTERNILKDGFWAKSPAEELPCPGLEVEFVKQTLNVTEIILGGIQDNMDETARNNKIRQNIRDYETAYYKINKRKAIVKSYYEGNQYWASIMETYSDVRLVGFPPNGIGKFGGDTDNWMWPRHTGDFAVFRVYTDKNNMPAAYSQSNVPYKPKKFFPVQAGGYKEDDFSMVYGFPYKTNQYLSSYQVKLIQEVIDPIRINARGARLAAWDKTMRTDPVVFLKYAAKQSSVSNGWKKWQGEIRGLELNDVIGKKQAYEKSFQSTAGMASSDYKEVLGQLQLLVAANENTIAANEMIHETVLAVEIIKAGQYLEQIVDLYRDDSLPYDKLNQELDKLYRNVQAYYKNYDMQTDMNAFDTLMPLYLKSKSIGAVPAEVEQIYLESGGTIASLRNIIFQSSILTNQGMVEHILKTGDKADTSLILQDPAYQMYHALSEYKSRHITPKITAYQRQSDKLNRIYTKGQLEYNIDGKTKYPDANQTLRLTYGPIKGIQPYGSSTYSYQTNIDEVIAKTNPSIEEFHTPQKLIRLYDEKDFGQWAVNGTVPVAFLSQNHTSGGNSGSPVLNAKGELIGINFDRIWDGTMSDIYYDPRLCRNISVDIRYVLFIIEKFGDAGWLLKEMDIRK